MKKTKETYKHTTKEFPSLPIDITRKNVFPYDWLDSEEKLEEEYPCIEKFYSQLTNENISTDEHNFGKYVWEKLGFSYMKEYLHFYLKIDILGLCDLFENYRTKSLEDNKLDPSYYLSLPALSWDCMLRHTKAEIELLTNNDKYLFFEKSIRGLSIITHRNAIANNKFMEDYDKTKETSFIMYYDANSLYATAVTL